MKTKMVVLTGAGISAESGLKTFRDSDGLWEGYDIEEVANPRGWRKNPRLVLEFYNMRRKNVREASPNAAHKALAALEDKYDITIITQNIDDLHERAGSTEVVHLHGQILKMRSERDTKLLYDISGDIQWGDLAEDGAQLRPAIVWFEEEVPMISKAMEIMSEADIVVIIGTSLAVYPAAGLIHYAPKHARKFIIDKKIPHAASIPNLIVIEMPATEGVLILKEMLGGE